MSNGLGEFATPVGKMYEGTKARVLTPDRKTEEFEIQAGVLQGDTLHLCHHVRLLHETGNRRSAGNLGVHSCGEEKQKDSNCGHQWPRFRG